nr:MAG TPA: hypothetical protein [Caudoviricetes sp.]
MLLRSKGKSVSNFIRSPQGTYRIFCFTVLCMMSIALIIILVFIL